MTTGAEAPIAYAITKAAIAALAKPATRTGLSSGADVLGSPVPLAPENRYRS